MKKFVRLACLVFALIFAFSNSCVAEIPDNSVEKPLEIWVPYNPEKELSGKNIGNKHIFIKESDLNEIKNNNYYKKPEPDKPTYNYHITSANFYATVKNGIANFSGVYKINKVSDDWSLIPVISKDIGLSAAYVDGKIAFLPDYRAAKKLTKSGNLNLLNKYHLLAVKGSGEKVLKINFTLDVNKDEEDKNIEFVTFKTPKIPILKIECSVDRENLAFSVPVTTSTKVELLKGKTKLTANYAPTKLIDLKWAPRSSVIETGNSAEIELPPSINATTYSKVEVGKGLLKGSFVADINIRRSPIDRFVLSVPDDIEIDGISAHGYELVDPYPEVINGELPVELTTSADGRLKLTINYRKNFDSPSFKTNLPAISFINREIDRETGYVALLETTSIETSILESDKTKNYREIDSGELKGILRGLKPSIAIKYNKNKENISSKPYDITVDVIRHKDIAVYEAAIDSVYIDSVISEEGNILSKALFQVKNTRKQFLEIKLPENTGIWSVYVDNKPVKPALKGESVYAIPLLKSSSSEKNGKVFPIEVVYFTEKNGLLSSMNLGFSKFSAIESELFANSVRWNIYTPEKTKFIPLEIFSNLQIEKSGYRKSISSSRNRRITNNIINRAKKETMAQMAGREYRSLDQSVRPSAPMEIEESLREDKLPPPVYRSKKVGKLPVYLNLPLIGNAYSFYQLSFESDKMPYIFALYSDIDLIRFLTLVIALATGYIAYSSYIKHGKKSGKFIMSTALATFFAFQLVGWFILLPVLTLGIYLLHKNNKLKLRFKKDKKTLIALSVTGLLLVCLLFSILLNIFHLYLAFLLASVLIISAIWIIVMIVKFVNKKWLSGEKIEKNLNENKTEEEGQN